MKPKQAIADEPREDDARELWFLIFRVIIGVLGSALAVLGIALCSPLTVIVGLWHVGIALFIINHREPPRST